MATQLRIDVNALEGTAEILAKIVPGFTYMDTVVKMRIFSLGIFLGYCGRRPGGGS